MATLKLHPEQKDDEFFIENIYNPSNKQQYEDYIAIEGDPFENIDWRTKRKGSTSYDIHGKYLHDHVPIFLQKSEVKAKSSKLYEMLEKRQQLLYPEPGSVSQ